MTERARHLITISVTASAPQFREQLLTALREAKASGEVKREAVYECLLQTYLFAGFPAALEAMRALKAAWPNTEEKETEKPKPVSYPEFLERGQRLFENVYGANAERVKEGIRELSPELAAWTMSDGYSKTLSRPGLDAPTRELCTVAALTWLGWERQLLSHILGARNCGASNADIKETIELGSMGDEPRRARALRLIAK